MIAAHNSSRVRFALVGFGAWGSHHARAIIESPRAQLVAIAAHSEKSQAAAREAHPSARVVSDYRELLADDSIEVVDVVLPSHLHHRVGRAALEADKHLLMEKPMALSEGECDDLLRCARERDRLLAVGHEFRFSSLWGRAKEMIDAGVIGEPKYLLIELWRRPYRLGADGWRYDIKRVGNWILEEPIHFFDLARWYFAGAGDPISVFARASANRPEHPELQDNFSAIVNFPRGGYAVIAQTLSAFEHHQVVKVTGTCGALWASWSGAIDRTFRPTFSLKHFDGEKVQDVMIEKATGEVFELVDEITAMCAAVRDGAPLPATGEDGRWSVAMCLLAQQSVDTGQPVNF
ncbi:MAG TPA: Gfo/Idh/MocA family oxidoreductase [Chthoniobacteraceae bacterium]|nr:Gfo/Idh/MocA family oxidoreductase [Chthoniobacteraceae bacterium]